MPQHRAGRRTPGGDGSRRSPRSSWSARSPSSSRPRTPRDPLPGACPALRIVTAASFAPILTHRRRRCGPLDVTVADGRGCGGPGRRGRRRPVDPRRRGVARRPRAPGPGRGARRRTPVPWSRRARSTSSPTTPPPRRIKRAGGGWGALAELVTAPGSRVRLVAHDPGGSGDGLLGARRRRRGGVAGRRHGRLGRRAGRRVPPHAHRGRRHPRAAGAAGRGRPGDGAGAARRHHHRAHGHRARRPHGPAALQLVPLRRGRRRPRTGAGARGL